MARSMRMRLAMVCSSQCLTCQSEGSSREATSAIVSGGWSTPVGIFTRACVTRTAGRRALCPAVKKSRSMESRYAMYAFFFRPLR